MIFQYLLELSPGEIYTQHKLLNDNHTTITKALSENSLLYEKKHGITNDAIQVTIYPHKGYLFTDLPNGTSVKVGKIT